MIAATPAPPYVAVIFTSQRSDQDRAGYDAMAADMERLGAQQPGFLGIESARGGDGFGITVSYWRTVEDARAWKAIGEHLAAQRLGRARWYRVFRVRIAEVAREYGYDRDSMV
ncbi:MAG TPA: antibiotic biosynthesis monooxygenase [Polyangia bacterium]|jgi:heme-degrading monooxygenase HmoA|nr:antibiotic biosynthesis monooxygenase [Polyangia bacterium]